jgi:Zinc knuckle
LLLGIHQQYSRHQTSHLYLYNHQKTPSSCYNCHKLNHFSRNCPEPRRTFHQQQRGSGERPTTQIAQQEQTMSLPIRGITTLNRGADGHSTYLKARIGKRLMDCLLDTGSETTVLPVSIVNPKLIRNTTQILTAANGTSTLLLG